MPWPWPRSCGAKVRAYSCSPCSKRGSGCYGDQIHLVKGDFINRSGERGSVGVPTLLFFGLVFPAGYLPYWFVNNRELVNSLTRNCQYLWIGV